MEIGRDWHHTILFNILDDGWSRQWYHWFKETMIVIKTYVEVVMDDNEISHS